MSFKLLGSLNPHGGPILRSEIVANSVVVRELQSLNVNSSGFLRLSVVNVPIFGHVAAIQTDQGVGLETDGTTGAATGSFNGVYTVASDNQTVAKVRAVCDISKETLYSVDPDAAIGTTAGSNLLGFKTTLATSTATSESSASTANGEYNIWGVDPGVAANQVVSILTSQMFGGHAVDDVI
mgnify:CR=1 FL=1